MVPGSWRSDKLPWSSRVAINDFFPSYKPPYLVRWFSREYMAWIVIPFAFQLPAMYVEGCTYSVSACPLKAIPQKNAPHRSRFGWWGLTAKHHGPQWSCHELNRQLQILQSTTWSLQCVYPFKLARWWDHSGKSLVLKVLHSTLHSEAALLMGNSCNWKSSWKMSCCMLYSSQAHSFAAIAMMQSWFSHTFHKSSFLLQLCIPIFQPGHDAGTMPWLRSMRKRAFVDRSGEVDELSHGCKVSGEWIMIITMIICWLLLIGLMSWIMILHDIGSGPLWHGIYNVLFIDPCHAYHDVFTMGVPVASVSLKGYQWPVVLRPADHGLLAGLGLQWCLHTVLAQVATLW